MRFVSRWRVPYRVRAQTDALTVARARDPALCALPIISVLAPIDREVATGAGGKVVPTRSIPCITRIAFSGGSPSRRGSPEQPSVLRSVDPPLCGLLALLRVAELLFCQELVCLPRLDLLHVRLDLLVVPLNLLVVPVLVVFRGARAVSRGIASLPVEVHHLRRRPRWISRRPGCRWRWRRVWHREEQRTLEPQSPVPRHTRDLIHDCRA